MYFVPSVQKEVKFNNFTIEQFYYISQLTKKENILNTNFNIGFINILKQNILEDILLTNFDKEILLLQIYLNEIKEGTILLKNIEHPNTQFINEVLYTIKITVPDINRELEFCNNLIKINKNDKDTLLLFEVAKHLTNLTVNKTELNCQLPLINLVNTIKNLPPYILAKCVVCIDNIKKQTKAFYKQNKVNYKYSIDLLVP